ncbi:uncharacterized protein PGRI_081930 [Penicillium griseofulvum]|uniref:S-adenosyl-L-methionine-dependent methyltransferase n=1 Tax=Penicillium patulum TaxID=5078 RepID=A0A135LVD7_PENPA|nr:uncharacterized protein PGRI_081930 [Penicillium griseofulvum]KXG52938.1 hypothetical protein PGRI_081930 [Penicillium griseofulvum]
MEAIAVDQDLYPPESAHSPDDWLSETTSIKSSIYRGLMENGRRYQALSNKEYWYVVEVSYNKTKYPFIYSIPSDEQQFETYEAGHLVDLIMDSDQPNPLFRSPIGSDRERPLQVLDIGTGKGTWAIDVADMFPNATVRGVDLFPPPVTWMPPNCVIEVDDVLQEWTWRAQFDLIHMRNMIGSFDSFEWDRIYQHCFQKMAPGGWIEQIEVGPFITSDDGSLPPDSALSSWGPLMQTCGDRAGRSCDIVLTMSESIKNAGFVDVHEKVYKWPIGPWPRDQKFKEAGMVNCQHWMSGMEGWCMWLLTKFGDPQPWTKEEVHVYCAKLRSELKNPYIHAYHKARRVWARKPMPGELPPRSSTSSSSTPKANP